MVITFSWKQKMGSSCKKTGCSILKKLKRVPFENPKAKDVIYIQIEHSIG